MEVMIKHQSHSAAFKGQVAEEFIAKETLHALAQRRDISPQLIRIWVSKLKADALDDEHCSGHCCRRTGCLRQ
jgi:transposase